MTAAEVTSLDSRRQTLGGSTLPTAAGIDPYCSPIRLWLEMTGRESRPESDAMTWGKRLEPVILDALRDDGYMVAANPGEALQNVSQPWLVGHPDGYYRHDDRPGVVEAKAVGTWAAQANGAAPAHYQAQVQTYLHLTGLDHGLIAALVGGQKLELHELERNDGAIALLLEAGERFMEYVRADKRPPVSNHPDDRAALLAAEPDAVKGKAVRATREQEELVRELTKRLEQDKAVKARVEHLRARISEGMGDAELLVSRLDVPLARWSTVTSNRLDTRRFRKERPELADVFSEATTTRRFSLV